MEAINAPPLSIHGTKYDKVAHHYELKQYYTCEYDVKKRCQTSEGILLLYLPLLKVFWFQQYYLWKADGEKNT